ncbi:DNA helicase B-like [Mizuhopecten yessoensis]|uniref:DNA helicase B n=1 Tax=Mizuhopecten yessoensis TaxID=6573 RepID=A0A210PMD1_MIZYE|nr:DNA helicase B-like [Mizuhopecten yessoensis]OWF37649.1 DNA helicase B [Mizuhopecten yessoensis]
MAAIGQGYLPYFESKYYDKMGIFTKNEEDNDTEDFDPVEDICDERIQDLSSSEIKKIGKGAMLMEPSTPRAVTGTLYNPNGKKRWSVKARLHLDNPWWIVRLLRTDTYKGYVVPTGQNAVSYRLITDHHLVKQHKMVEILLTDRCSDNRAALDKFEQFVQMRNEELRLDVTHLLDLLQKFEDYLPDDDKGIVSQITKRLTGFDGKMIKRAQEFPELFRYLPQLVPHHFLSLINTGQVTILERLDFALKEEPWVFAFKRILVKEYNVMGVEVSQEVLRKCGILSKIPKLYREAIELYTYVKNETNAHGHTCLQLNSIYHDKRLEKLNKVREQTAALQYLYDKEILVKERMGGKVWTFPYDLWKSEVNIAKGLNHLFQQHINKPEILDIDIRNNPEFENISKDKDQMKAAEFIKNYPVVVISGKGGCGKTTVVTKVMSETYKASSSKEISENLIVLYTAPTGKAAKLLGRKAGTDGYTLHQIIYSYRGYLKQKPESPWKFSSTEVLIVDECSMVPVHIFATLLDILQRNSNLKRVVFLGDIRQLPSVQPGNFLADIFKPFEWKPGCSVELRTNHRAESELIVKNATKISSRKMPQFDDRSNYRLHPVLANKQNPDQEEYENENFRKVLEEMLRSQDNMKDHTTSHIIAFRRNMCKVINQLAMEFYNPDPVEGRSREINKFRIGDKVGLYKNGWVNIFKWEDGRPGSVRPVFVEDNDDNLIQPTQLPAGIETPCKIGTAQVLPYEKELSVCHSQEQELLQGRDHSTGSLSQSGEKEQLQKKLRLCNGEIYFIKDDYEQDEEVKNGAHRQRRYLKLSDEDPDSPTEFYALYSQLMRECKMTQAWAKTIHTFQGSECDTITFVVGNCKNQNWSHVYTAVTRGRSSVNIVGQEACLQMSVKKDPIHRMTGLSHQLNNIISANLRDELFKIARNGGSPAKSKVQGMLINDSFPNLDGTENRLTYDRSSVSAPYLSGHTTPTKSSRTPSLTGYLTNHNGDSGRSRSECYQGSSGSSNHHIFKGQGSERYTHFTSHNPSIQSPAKSRLFTETASNVATPSGCHCHDTKACICGVTPISLVSTKRQVDASPGDAEGDGETCLYDSQWSDVSNTDDLFTSEDQILQHIGEDSDGDSDETVDMSGEHFHQSDEEFFTDIKPVSECMLMSSASRLSVSASLSSLSAPLRIGQNLMNPSPKRPAEADDSLDSVTPAKQMYSATLHTGMTPVFKKLKF